MLPKNWLKRDPPVEAEEITIGIIEVDQEKTIDMTIGETTIYVMIEQDNY